MHRLTIAVLALATLLHGPGTPARAVEEEPVELGKFLFMTTSRTRSLSRRLEFLEPPRNAHTLQLAIVLDGTESMAGHIQSLRENFSSFLKNIQRLPDEGELNVELALVAYRDSLAPSGAATLLTPEFTTVKQCEQALQQLATESGEPYYREMVDAGLFAAMSKLKWAPPEQTTTARWLLLCGDAPPYPELAFSPEHNGIPRRHASSELLEVAKQKRITIHSLLLDSMFDKGQDLQEIEAERPDAVRFMSEMAKQSGGNFADLSNRAAANYWIQPHLPLAPIRPEEVGAAREQAARPDAGFRCALLPSLRPARGLADEAERSLEGMARRLWGVQILSTDDIRQLLNDVPSAWDEGHARRLGKALDCRFLLSTDLRPYLGDVVGDVKLWDAEDGSVIAVHAPSANHQNTAEQIARQAVRDLLHKSKDAVGPETAEAFRRSLQSDIVTGRRRHRLAQGENAEKFIADALLQLNRIDPPIGVTLPSPETESANRELLSNAVKHLDNAIDAEPANALAHFLLAQCYFKLARLKPPALDLEHDARFREQMELAWFARQKSADQDNPLEMLIEAQYYLHTDQHMNAVQTLERIVSASQAAHSPAALRAHWLLAGVRLGDWNTAAKASQLLSSDRARTHIIQILAHWPESAEADYCRRFEGWRIPAGAMTDTSAGAISAGELSAAPRRIGD